MTTGTRGKAAAVRREEAHAFEVAGRVLSLLLDTGGPLSGSLGFHLWPAEEDGDEGFVLSWRGTVPTVIEVIQFLVNSSADDERTTVLSPGDVTFDFATESYVEVLGVRFRLDPEPMLSAEELESVIGYWRCANLRETLQRSR